MEPRAAPVLDRLAASRRRMAIVLWGPVVLALAALVVSGQAGAVLEALASARPGAAVLLLPIGLALPVVHARRWQAMLRAVAADVPLAAAIEMTVSASLVNYAVPGYVGSPVKGLMARQLHGIGFGRSLPTLAAEQGLDATALLVGTLVGLTAVGPASVTWLRELFDGTTVLALVGLAVAATLVLLAAGLLARRHARRFLHALAGSGRMLAADRRQRGPIALLTLAYWLLGVAAVWVAAEAVGISLRPLGLLLLSNVPLLLGLVSPLPGGLGLREAAMAGIAGALGLSVSGIVAAAVLQRAILVAALPLSLGGARLARRIPAWR